MTRAEHPGSAGIAVSVGGARLMRLASYAAVAVASTLILAKGAAWLVTGSVAVLTSLIDSALDVLASLINLIAVRRALEPADAEHRFGHGKAEAVAGLGQGAFIAGSAVFVVYEALHRLIFPEPVAHEAIGIAVMALSIILTVGLVLFQRRAVAVSGSLAISADSLHYTGDLYMNLSVIAALVLTAQFDIGFADPVFAIVIAGIVIKSAYEIFRQSLDQVMDREFPDADRERIRTIVLAHPKALEMHDLRTRWAGTQPFIQLHLVLDSHLTLLQAHAISDEIETRIRAAFPTAEVIIHEDPEGIEEHHPDLAAT
jgi:ferrous-iron efflux pump FieF